MFFLKQFHLQTLRCSMVLQDVPYIYIQQIKAINGSVNISYTVHQQRMRKKMTQYEAYT